MVLPRGREEGVGGVRERLRRERERRLRSLWF